MTATSKMRIKKATTFKAKTTKTFCGICSDWEIKQPEKCSNTLVLKGKKHFFCTAKCKVRFTKTPDKFL